MSQTESQPILEQIDTRLAALAAAEKALKRPSTVSFAERRELTMKAAAAAAELRARRAELESGGGDAAPAPEGEGEASAVPEAVQTALDSADRILGRIQGAQPAGPNLGRVRDTHKLPGQNRRGGGMSSQNRAPDRIGGE